MRPPKRLLKILVFVLSLPGHGEIHGACEFAAPCNKFGVLSAQPSSDLYSFGFDGRFVLWRDNRAGEFMYVYDLETQRESRLSQGPGSNGEVSEGVAVWRGDGNEGLYAKDFIGRIWPADEAPRKIRDEGSNGLAIHGDWMGATLGTEGDNPVYAFNLRTSESVLAADFFLSGEHVGRTPRLGDRRLVWTSGGDIYGLDLSTTTPTPLTIENGPANMTAGPIHGNRMIVNEVDGPKQVWLYDFATQQMQPISAHGTVGDLWGDFVIYADTLSDLVMLHDLRTGEACPVASAPGGFGSGATGLRVANNIVVWQSNGYIDGQYLYDQGNHRKLNYWDRSTNRFLPLPLTPGIDQYNPGQDLLVLVHGLDFPLNGLDDTINDDPLFTGFAEALESGTGANILAWDWKAEARLIAREHPETHEAEFVLPTSRAVHDQAPLLANCLGDLIQSQGGGRIALLGHSLGAALAAHAARGLEYRDAPIDVLQLTLFDAPEDENANFQTLGFLFNYILDAFFIHAGLDRNMNVLLPGARLAGTLHDLSSDGMHDVRVDNYISGLGINYESYDGAALQVENIDLAATGHAYGMSWFRETIATPHLTTLHDADGNPIAGRHAGWALNPLWSGHALEPDSFLPGTTWERRSLAAQDEHKVYATSPLGLYDLATTESMEVGSIEGDNYAGDLASGLTLTEGSPAWAETSVTAMAAIKGLRFKYRFTNVGDGDRVYGYCNDIPCWTTRGEFHDAQRENDSGIVQIDIPPGQTGAIRFHLQSFGQSNAAIEIYDVEFLGSQTVPVRLATFGAE